jgi:2-amino-4-hydroxy-6-hydroxymethyldihydropteridine diphosphokinase
MAQALIGLGANLGDRAATLHSALAGLREHPQVQSVSASSHKETVPVGGPAEQPAFLNAAALLETSLAPRALLEVLHDIERRLGRQRDAPWGARTIDLDLLLYEHQVIDEPDLKVPHPRMAFRRFALEPAAEVAPRLVHPQIDWTIERLLEHLNKTPHYVAVAGLPRMGKTLLARRVAMAAGAAFCPDPELDTISESAPGCNGAMSVELSLTRSRAAMLERHRAKGPAEMVSDFWIEQSWAYAQTLAEKEQQAAFREVFDKVLLGAVRTTLVVFLAADPRPRYAALAAQLHALATRPGRGPFLVLDAADFEHAVEETTAALLAMR